MSELEQKLRDHPLVAPRLKHERDTHAAEAAVRECICGEAVPIKSWLRSSTYQQVKLAFSQIAWHTVKLGNVAKDEVAKISADGFVNKCSKAFQLAGVVDPDVFYDAQGHILYFSPRASAVAAAELREQSAVPCLRPPNVDNYRKLGAGL